MSAPEAHRRSATLIDPHHLREHRAHRTSQTYIRLCQEVVAALVDGGDSGSPVFRRKGGGSNVVLLGVLWGGSVDEANPEFVYSPMFGIERELGELTTF